MNTYLINTETMEWPIYEGDFRLMFPNTSFPSPIVNPPYPYFWVQDTPQPAYNWVTQGIKEVTPKNFDNSWFRQWEVYELSAEQIAENEQQQKNGNKQIASGLLQETDWTATVDISNPQYSNPYLTNQDAFLSYRSQVRQIAINPPIVVEVWPVKPDEVWSS